MLPPFSSPHWRRPLGGDPRHSCEGSETVVHWNSAVLTSSLPGDWMDLTAVDNVLHLAFLGGHVLLEHVRDNALRRTCIDCESTVACNTHLVLPQLRLSAHCHHGGEMFVDVLKYGVPAVRRDVAFHVERPQTFSVFFMM